MGCHYITLTGHSSDIIVLNDHAPTENKYEDNKGEHLRGTTVGTQSIAKVQHENFVKRFQYKGSGDGKTRHQALI
jgi:hypothetical protein